MVHSQWYILVMMISVFARESRLSVDAVRLYVRQGLLHPEIGQKGGSWSARLEMCQWRRETLDKESIWDEARSTNLSRW